MALPAFAANGDMPAGVHPASLREVLLRFGTGSPQRQTVAILLERIWRLATATGQVARFIVFGSFVTAKVNPNDGDVFLLMEDTFDASIRGDTGLVFDHTAAQATLGGSVFWLRRLAAFGGEQATVEYWQNTRAGTLRGIVEIVSEVP